MSKRLFYGSIYMLGLFSISLFSCKKSIETGNNSFPGNSFPIPASSPVNGGVSGRIIDENNAPVASAAITCAGLSTVTNAEGFFSINNAVLDKYISTVTVSKAGYFKGYRSFSAEATRNFVNIKLIPKTLSGTISSSSGGIITLSNSTEINFQQNSMVIKGTGVAYNGTVNVYASYIDPTREDMASVVPGSFMGRDANNLYSLQSTGMLAVDIESPSGEALQLVTNLPATIKLPIPSSLVSKAPTTIDTWSLDEQGVWKKEDVAQKVGDHYEFSATHFSFWNCDYPSNAIYLSLHIKDNNGNNLSNVTVTLTIANNSTFSSSTYGITDASGDVAGMVPADYEIQLQISPGIFPCSAPLYTQNIGSFNTDATLTVTASLTTQQFTDNELQVSGTVNNCSGQPVEHAVAMIYSGIYYTFADVTNGVYSTILSHCDTISSVTAVVIDTYTLMASVPVISSIFGNMVQMPAITLPCALSLNNYDGVYEVTGTLTDMLNAGYTSDFPFQVQLVTKDSASVYVTRYINATGTPMWIPGYTFNAAGTNTIYGNFGLQVSFDSANNTVSAMHNYYGDPSNPPTNVGDPSLGTGQPNYQAAAPRLRTAFLDPTGLNNYDPTTRVIHIKYLMNDATYSITSPRVHFDETWTYVGPR